ncbi:hypothetical protein BZG36_04797 [Bifiguratus adelaidae]|uniref:Nucleoporin Pom152 n=1 Tax=Bifiguratus adelaidae TaxID=1938954 RepID=A0A261XUT4_9FUNG|nr:hypothetical protein BZG36_04797 [Bifiguratus adelaidae]
MAPSGSPRIPLRILDGPTQRTYAVAALGVLCAGQLFEFASGFVRGIARNSLTLFLKWTTIDYVFILVIALLRIPWLEIGRVKLIVLFVVALLTNCFLFYNAPILWAYQASPTRLLEMPSTSFKALTGPSFRDMGSHIVGKHTVHILPPSSGQFNQDNMCFCLSKYDPDHKEQLIPIQIRNAIPRYVEISRYDIDSGHITRRNVSERELIRKGDSGYGASDITEYFYRAKQTGIYRIEGIYSKNPQDVVRVHPGAAYVLPCPEAKLTSPDAQAEQCIGATSSSVLQVVGVPPLTVTYVKEINGHKKLSKVNNIQPEGFQSIFGAQLGKRAFTLPDQELTAVKSHQFEIPLDVTFDRPGQLAFYVETVQDGCGNIVKLNERAQGSKEHYTVHDLPTVKFDCDNSRPNLLLENTTSTMLPLKVTGQAPFSLDLRFQPFTDASAIREQKITLQSTQSAIEADKPGVYSIIGFKNNLCSGVVMSPSSCEVIQPPFPQVEFTTIPIHSQCGKASEVGTDVVAVLHGTPPYQLSYNVMRKSKFGPVTLLQKTDRIDQSRHIVHFLPNVSGNYVYEFTKLDDLYYKDIRFKKQIEQTVHPQPNAVFAASTNHHTKRCIGESVALKVDLAGTTPFSLSWTVYFEGVRNTFNETDLGSEYTIVSPPLAVGGKYIVSLDKIKDANGCIKTLDSPDVIIEVRRDMPTATFYVESNTSAKINLIEGRKAKLPLRLTGEKPWSVEYSRIEGDAKSTVAKIDDPNGAIEVSEPGEYQLLAIRDAHCAGEVSLSTYQVSRIGKPSISVNSDQVSFKRGNTYVRHDICQGSTDSVDVVFRGHPSFSVSYDIMFWSVGRGEVQQLRGDTIHSAFAVSSVQMRTDLPGLFQYTFSRLADSHYTTPNSDYSPSGPLIIKQTVHAHPSAAIRKYARPNICVGDRLDSEQLNPLQLDLVGKAPFRIEIAIRRESETSGKSFVIDDIQSNTYEARLPYTFAKSGAYHIDILSVQDAAGCVNNDLIQKNPITIHASDVPSIATLDNARHHCVGDILDYSLSGVAPFKIGYMYNGRHHEKTTKHNKVSLHADKPGNLTILSIGDQRNKCRSYPNDMTKEIHGIPTVKVEGGRVIEESIRSGEQAEINVEFVGVPPFEFEWIRKETVYDKRRNKYEEGRVVESNVVANIEDDKYSFSTSSAGTVEAVSVRDRYCRYPRL